MRHAHYAALDALSISSRSERSRSARAKVKESWGNSAAECTLGRDENDGSEHDSAQRPGTRRTVPVSRPRRAPTGLERLRPLPSVLRRAGVATLALLGPIFAVLYFLTVPDGAWPAILLAQVVVMAVLAVTALTYSRVAVWVGPDGITERGFFGSMTHLPTDDIGVILLVHTFHGGGADTLPQLFICDGDGRQVIRLRGEFWSIRDMGAVCETLDVPLTELAESVTSRELLAQYPGLLYWFERHPVVASTICGVAVLAAASALYAGLSAVGVG